MYFFSLTKKNNKKWIKIVLPAFFVSYLNIKGENRI